jgi:signal transduction histidine kinase
MIDPPSSIKSILNSVIQPSDEIVDEESRIRSMIISTLLFSILIVHISLNLYNSIIMGINPKIPYIFWYFVHIIEFIAYLISRSKYFKLSSYFLIILVSFVPYIITITNLSYFIAVFPMTSVAVIVISALLYDTKTTILISILTIFQIVFLISLRIPTQVPPKNYLNELLFVLIAISIFIILNSFLLNSRLERIKENNVQLEKIAHQRKDLDQLRANFVSMASHELRTPLTVIKGYMSFLPRIKENENDEKMDLVINSINKNVTRLERLVNNTGEITRFEKNMFQLESKLFDFNEFLRNFASSYQSLFGDQIEFSLCSSIQKTLFKGDENRIHQVLDNIMDNAIKNTSRDNRRIVLKGKITPRSVRIIITDNGSGIEEKNL